MLVGTRKGGFIFRSDAARRSWKVVHELLIGSTVHHMVIDPRDGRTILMTERGGHLGPTIMRSTDLGKTWQEATQPPAFPTAADGGGRVLDHNFWLSPGHPSEPGVWYVGTSPHGLFRSEDAGLTWEPVSGFNDHPMRQEWSGPDSEGPPGGPRLHSILIDPRDPNHLYISLSGGGVFESTDRGDSWAPLNKGIISDFLPVPDAEYGHDPHSTRLHPLEPDRLYQQNHFGVYVMDRGEGTWRRIGTNLPKDISDHGFPIVVHPRDPDTAWIFPNEAFPYARVPHDGKPATFVTHNAGNTWKRQDKGMPDRGGWFTVKRQAMNSDTREPLGLYFGTTGGEIWASRNAGESWAFVADHLPEIFSVEVGEIGIS
jgi:photosystem II stability/assembly factor-like uncharacterized protein